MIYIEREALIEIAEQQGHVSFDDIINEPAADVAPVVRCKDCEFRKPTFSGADYFCTVWDADNSETAYVTGNDFCSYGKQKDGEG